MTFDPRDPSFYDGDALDAELERVFDICHGCRMCFNYCPSFPALLDAVDAHEERGEGEVKALTTAEKWRVVDLCYQCKLCYVKCPYTPPHEFMVDFPRLMLRAKATRARRGPGGRPGRVASDHVRQGDGRGAAVALSAPRPRSRRSSPAPAARSRRRACDRCASAP